MADHPTTFHGEPAGSAPISWNDYASIRRKDSGGGVLHAMQTLHSGTLAEMVAMVRNMPADERDELVIQKAGDRLLDAGDIMALAEREDFPG